MIELKGVSKRFGDKTVLHRIDLMINPDEITFIIGSSGAGKSTLLNLIGGLDSVSSGSICFNNKNITNYLTRYRAENVGFIFQDYNLISGLSVKENIELGLLYSNLTENIPEIDKQISKLGIKDQNQPVETLSGGEKQRVAIIRSICKESDIILADEATGNLDSINAKLVFELLVNIKQGKHIIVVSHDLNMAREFGDRIITLSDGEIIEDIRTAEKTNQVMLNDAIPAKTNNKQTINWKAVTMLGCNSLKKRFSKILSISLVISLAISALAIMFDLNTLGNSVSKDVNVNYLENDLISIFYSHTANMGHKETPFSESDINHVRSAYKTKEIVPLYMERDTWLFSNQNKTKEAVIKQINIDDFFRNRVMSYDIKGEFIKNKDEIILAYDVAKELYGESCIGKEIALNDGSGQNVNFKIVGINRTVNPFDKIYSIVSSIKIKELLEKVLATELANHLELSEFKEKETTEPVNVTTGGIYAPMKVIQENDEILYGHQPREKNEIMISSILLPYALPGFDIKCSYSEKDILSETLSKDVIAELLSRKIALKHNGLFQLHITGVYKSDQIGMRFQSSLIKDLKEIEPTTLEAYLPQTIDIARIKQDINNGEKFTCLLQLESLKNNISKQTSYFKWAIILAGLIMLLISIAMLGSFSKIAVLERKREVAIIKSLGATDREVLVTLWFDSIAISLIAFIFSLLITGLFISALPHLISEMSFINFEYPVVSLITLGICFVTFICFYTLLSLKTIVKKMPAELFKH